jgi:hypothetical protein
MCGNLAEAGTGMISENLKKDRETSVNYLKDVLTDAADT